MGLWIFLLPIGTYSLAYRTLTHAKEVNIHLVYTYIEHAERRLTHIVISFDNTPFLLALFTTNQPVGRKYANYE